MIHLGEYCFRGHGQAQSVFTDLFVFQLFSFVLLTCPKRVQFLQVRKFEHCSKSYSLLYHFHLHSFTMNTYLFMYDLIQFCGHSWIFTNMIIRFMSFGKGRIPSLFSLNISEGSNTQRHQIRDKLRILDRCMSSTGAKISIRKTLFLP